MYFHHRRKRHRALSESTRVALKDEEKPVSPEAGTRDGSRSTAAPCVFYSFGIDYDYSFDSYLAASPEWHCDGFLFDPSVNHRSVMTSTATGGAVNNTGRHLTQSGRLLFSSMGANLLPSDMLSLATMTDSSPASAGRVSTRRGVLNNLSKEQTTAEIAANIRRWVFISPAQLPMLYNHQHIAVLKLDCEGCEYALARDMAIHNPSFLARVDQFVVEVHLAKHWASTDEHIHYWGLLLHVLREAQFTLVHAAMGGCHKDHEATGCPEGLVSIGYPCRQFLMCHNYVFAKV